MRADNWKIFDKKGSNLNVYTDAFLDLKFITDAQNANGAEGYALTNPDGSIYDTVITNSGWNYDEIGTQVELSYAFSDYSEILSSAEASINFIDVSVFNPTPSTVKGIGSVYIDPVEVSINFGYPSVVFASAIFMNPVSVQLVETEHLSLLEESSTGTYIRPYDPINGTLIFRFSDGDPEIKLFEVDQDEQKLIWAEELIFDVSEYIIGSPLIINVGFRSEDEGVFERKLRGYHRINGEDYQIMEILVNSQSIGPDERFDTLAQDFGLPNPKDTPHLFKEADINEAMPDWQLLNYKGKHIILEQAQIMPYIGTYKALINSIKWLGYEDIKVKEWFRDVKENKKLSLYVPYEAADRTKTILYFSPEERKNLKKLNELSLVYCITRETGEIDEWGNPLVEECYEYNISEILIKLKSLKDWLEKNIIGVNARITDVTGEGVYFERFRSFIYATQNVGNNALYTQSLTPDTIEETSELSMGEASIGLTLKEIQQTSIEDFKGIKFRDLLQYYWDPSNGAFSPEDASALWWDPSTLFVGVSFKFPFFNLFDIQWKASVEKTDAGVLDNAYVTNPLFIYENEIRYYNIFDSSTIFYEASTGLRILLEQGFLRDASNDDWISSIAYSIYPDINVEMDASTTKILTRDSSYAVLSGAGTISQNGVITSFNSSINPTYFTIGPSAYIIADTSTVIQTPFFVNYIVESSVGTIWKTDGFVNLRPDTSSLLQYAFDANYRVPLLSMKNYKFTDIDENIIKFETDKSYFLDILDGKIAMKAYIAEPSTFTSDPSTIMYRKEEHYINWTYDSSLLEQKITLNVVYESPRAPLYLYDPSIYYNSSPEDALVFDNSIYNMHVNHIGPYHIEVFGWDGQNNVYRNFLRSDYEVWTKYPTIWSYLDTSCPYGSSVTICPSGYLTPEDVSILSGANLYPIFDRQVPLMGLTLEQDVDDRYYIKVPSISYFVDLPDSGSIARFYNMTERVTARDGSIFTVDPDFQSFNDGDDVNLVLFDKGKYYFLDEASGNISATAGNDLTIIGIDTKFDLDGSTELYLLNDTRREIFNPENDLPGQTIELDISAYRFEPNQLVGIIIDDVCTGYAWGSSFRVLDSSTDGSIGYYHKLKGNVPEFILSDPSRYMVTAKHAWSSFADFGIDVESATEVNNEFLIYLDDTYYHQYYLDNTFVYVNILFDQEKVLDQWYDPSTDMGLVSGPYYPYAKAITIDPSTLVILDAFYDPSTYMLDQKNIWTVIDHDTDDIIFRVHNKSVPYIFTDPGTFDVQVEAYDSYGNLKLQYFEGLITVSDEA